MLIPAARTSEWVMVRCPKRRSILAAMNGRVLPG
jgi:hypothetical protein